METIEKVKSDPISKLIKKYPIYETDIRELELKIDIKKGSTQDNLI